MVVKDEIKLLLAPITEANFLADTPKRALETLQKIDRTDKSGQPFILMLLPVVEKVNRGYTDVTLSFVLGTVTKLNYSTDERQTVTFSPILEPIYAKFESLLKQGNHNIKSNYNITIEKTNQYYWGSEKIDGLDEYIDCIEVKNIELKIKNTICI